MDNFSANENEENQENKLEEQKEAPQGPQFIKITEDSVKQNDPENIQALINAADAENPLPPKSSKKFVISIKNDYLDYFEEMTPEKRSETINNFLKEQIATIDKRRRKKYIAKILRHLLIIVITVIIGFPLIFILVNHSLQSTLKSYKYMQVNFGKLYEQKNLNKLN